MISLREQVIAAVGDSPLVRSVDVVPRGHIRIETSFTHSDGGSVDLFVLNNANNITTVSDLGQTAIWLSYTWDMIMDCPKFEEELTILENLLPCIERIGLAIVRITGGK